MKRSMKILFAVTAILSGLASALAQAADLAQAINEKERTILAPSEEVIEMGEAVALNMCVNCHGMDGKSMGKNQPHLAGQRSVYLYRMLQAYQSGERMAGATQHPNSFLNDEAMLAVSAFYASLSPIPPSNLQQVAEEPEPIDADPFTDTRKRTKKCTKCHGETGNSTASGMPNLTAQNPEYFVTSMDAYLDGSRKHKLMKKLVSKLDEQTIKEMSIFYAVQQPERTDTQGEGNAETGSQLAQDCATCHGDDGNADNKSIPTLAGQDARYFIKAMKAYKNGKRQNKSMTEAVETLSEEDFKDLATFYAAKEPLKRDVRTPLKTTEWISRCNRCHGIDGNSTDPRFPMLAGQNEGYLRVMMEAYAAGGYPDSIMSKMSQPLSGTDIGRIVSHYASQEPKPVVYIQLPCPEAAD